MYATNPFLILFDFWSGHKIVMSDSGITFFGLQGSFYYVPKQIWIVYRDGSYKMVWNVRDNK